MPRRGRSPCPEGVGILAPKGLLCYRSPATDPHPTTTTARPKPRAQQEEPMADYEFVKIDGLEYSVPVGQKPRKKAPPYIVVMNDNCTSCAGSPMCMTECPVDCIHIMYEEDHRPQRVYVDNDVCIGCMNCFSYEVRPKVINKGDARENMEKYNLMDLMSKQGVCPWDAIELHFYKEGVERSELFYEQPKKVLEESSTED